MIVAVWVTGSPARGNDRAAMVEVVGADRNLRADRLVDLAAIDGELAVVARVDDEPEWAEAKVGARQLGPTGAHREPLPRGSSGFGAGVRADAHGLVSSAAGFTHCSRERGSTRMRLVRRPSIPESHRSGAPF